MQEKHTGLSEDELEAVSERVFEKLQAQIGRSAIRVIGWLLATGFLAVLSWLGFSTHK
jgi:hypothetical protein